MRTVYHDVTCLPTYEQLQLQQLSTYAYAYAYVYVLALAMQRCRNHAYGGIACDGSAAAALSHSRARALQAMSSDLPCASGRGQAVRAWLSLGGDGPLILTGVGPAAPAP